MPDEDLARFASHDDLRRVRDTSLSCWRAAVSHARHVGRGGVARKT
jgi:hypothetical protein